LDEKRGYSAAKLGKLVSNSGIFYLLVKFEF